MTVLDLWRVVQKLRPLVNDKEIQSALNTWLSQQKSQSSASGERSEFPAHLLQRLRDVVTSSWGYGEFRALTSLDADMIFGLDGVARISLIPELRNPKERVREAQEVHDDFQAVRDKVNSLWKGLHEMEIPEPVEPAIGLRAILPTPERGMSLDNLEGELKRIRTWLGGLSVAVLGSPVESRVVRASDGSIDLLLDFAADTPVWIAAVAKSIDWVLTARKKFWEAEEIKSKLADVHSEDTAKAIAEASDEDVERQAEESREELVEELKEMRKQLTDSEISPEEVTRLKRALDSVEKLISDGVELIPVLEREPDGDTEDLVEPPKFIARYQMLRRLADENAGLLTDDSEEEE